MLQNISNWTIRLLYSPQCLLSPETYAAEVLRLRSTGIDTIVKQLIHICACLLNLTIFACMWNKYTAAAALCAYEKEAEPSWTLTAEWCTKNRRAQNIVFSVCRYIAFILSLKVYTAYEVMSNFAWATITGIMGKEQSSKGSLPLARCCRGDGSECPLERIKRINTVILWNVTMTVM